MHAAVDIDTKLITNAFATKWHVKRNSVHCDPKECKKGIAKEIAGEKQIGRVEKELFA